MTPEELSEAIVRKPESRMSGESTIARTAKGRLFLEGDELSIASFACFLLGILLTVVGFPRIAWPVWWLGIAIAFVSLVFAKKKGRALVAFVLNGLIMPFPYYVYFPG